MIRNKFLQLSFFVVLTMLVSSISKAQVYDLYVAGVQVNSSNAADLSVINNVDGTVTYNPDTKTLTLENATIDGFDHAIKNAGVDGLTIRLIGDNFASNLDSPIDIHANTIILGGGKLSLEAFEYEGNGVCGIFIYKNCQLIIRNCTVDAVGCTSGIEGYDGVSGESLVVDKATVKAYGNIYGSVCDLENLTLYNCAITTPSGAVFSSSLHGIALNESMVKDQVVIEPFNGIQEDSESILGVSVYPNPALDFVEISIDNVNVKGLELRVYDMLGKLVQSKTITEQTAQLNIKNLQKGVYILNVGNNTQRFVKK